MDEKKSGVGNDWSVS